MSHEKYQFRDTLKENAGLSVYNTGYEQCENGQIWGPALRDHYLIHYVVSGSGILRCNGQEYAVSAGMLFIIFPSQVASYQADANDPWKYNWVGFNGTDARRLVKLTGLSKDQPVWCSNTPDETCALLRSIADASDNTAAADAEMVGRLYLFLAHLIKHSRARSTDDTHQTYVDNALRYIQYNYANNIGVADIARYVGISRSQLYRAFLQDFGVSPHAYLQTYRINEACSLLRDPAYSVAEVAGSVGFNDPLYFSRVFKSIKGTTPSDYQKKRKRS
ncbi:MAG: AraC family transcriptional regulator [Clostridia bacterium]|nr:AraC family transcriptional regulator [Clostridia bacterium]